MFHNLRLLFFPAACVLFFSGCSVSPEIHDKLVKRHVKFHTFSASNIHSKDISTNVNRDCIQVAGFVDNVDQYKKMVNILKEFRKDSRVINNVIVLPIHDDLKDESQLVYAVKDKLNQHGYSVKDISVQVRNGNVILSGFVNRHIQLNKISFIVKKIPGVKKIYNYLLYKQAH